MFKRILKYSLLTIAGLITIIFSCLLFLYCSADMKEPNLNVDISKYKIKKDSAYVECNGSYLQMNDLGLWEAYISGTPLDRGVAMGILSKDLLYYQEQVFVNEIKKIVPSETYLKFLGAFTRIFNRNLGEYIPQEYRNEIYGISLSCTHDFDYIGNAYERQLNYHAAHDIGHTMQEYMLVGCSSFGVWGNKSETSDLLIARNFDFYVGDDFAKNKLVSFVAPLSGYKFASVGWAGMIGVLSGMNEKGLTVTINAAKGSLPISAATPISILAREILQYASNINEAYTIAQKHKTFVSESLLIGSSSDGYAAIIEKTPSKIALYKSESESIICTNHYQSKDFAEDKANLDNIATSDSPYRYKRIAELLEKNNKLNPKIAADILRDRKGICDVKLGLCNEKAINQCIAHHSVIFDPNKLLMWVSTFPWQSGEYICYDLKEIFSSVKPKKGNIIKELSILPDTLFLNREYQNVLKYRNEIKRIKEIINNKADLSEKEEEAFIASNFYMYYVYELLGDYYNNKGLKNKALNMWREALNLELPTLKVKMEIEDKIKKIQDE